MSAYILNVPAQRKVPNFKLKSVTCMQVKDMSTCNVHVQYFDKIYLAYRGHTYATMLYIVVYI